MFLLDATALMRARSNAEIKACLTAINEDAAEQKRLSGDSKPPAEGEKPTDKFVRKPADPKQSFLDVYVRPFVSVNPANLPVLDKDGKLYSTETQYFDGEKSLGTDEEKAKAQVNDPSKITSKQVIVGTKVRKKLTDTRYYNISDKKILIDELKKSGKGITVYDKENKPIENKDLDTLTSINPDEITIEFDNNENSIFKIVKEKKTMDGVSGLDVFQEFVKEREEHKIYLRTIAAQCGKIQEEINNAKGENADIIREKLQDSMDKILDTAFDEENGEKNKYYIINHDEFKELFEKYKPSYFSEDSDFKLFSAVAPALGQLGKFGFKTTPLWSMSRTLTKKATLAQNAALELNKYATEMERLSARVGADLTETGTVTKAAKTARAKLYAERAVAARAAATQAEQVAVEINAAAKMGGKGGAQAFNALAKGIPAQKLGQAEQALATVWSTTDEVVGLAKSAGASEELLHNGARVVKGLGTEAEITKIGSKFGGLSRFIGGALSAVSIFFIAKSLHDDYKYGGPDNFSNNLTMTAVGGVAGALLALTPVGLVAGILLGAGLGNSIWDLREMKNGIGDLCRGAVGVVKEVKSFAKSVWKAIKFW